MVRRLKGTQAVWFFMWESGLHTVASWNKTTRSRITKCEKQKWDLSEPRVSLLHVALIDKILQTFKTAEAGEERVRSWALAACNATVQKAVLGSHSMTWNILNKLVKVHILSACLLFCTRQKRPWCTQFCILSTSWAELPRTGSQLTNRNNLHPVPVNENFPFDSKRNSLQDGFV